MSKCFFSIFFYVIFCKKLKFSSSFDNCHNDNAACHFFSLYCHAALLQEICFCSQNNGKCQKSILMIHKETRRSLLRIPTNDIANESITLNSAQFTTQNALILSIQILFSLGALSEISSVKKCRRKSSRSIDIILNFL